jgi:hypothetical protein
MNTDGISALIREIPCFIRGQNLLALASDILFPAGTLRREAPPKSLVSFRQICDKNPWKEQFSDTFACKSPYCPAQTRSVNTNG